MKLRKLFATAALTLCVAGASAVTPQEIRIYINPGHGSWSANCRPMGTVKHGANNAYSDINNDTTNFFESNTNLYKGFGVLEKLIEYGVPFDRTKNQTNSNPHRIGAALDLTQNIVFSRVKTGGYPAYTDYETHTENPDNDYYDRGLSVISAEVEANDFDMMISIHSNAASGIETNYLYYALDGYSNAASEKIALSKEMSRCGWNHSILDRHQQWTSYDYTMTKEELASGKGKIGQQNLGVLNHTVPGYLVEGYFHTYQPGRHRAMNWDVDRMEGVTYARGIADYFGWTKENTGDIYGVVRDLHEKFSHEFYAGRVGTPDMYLPLNNVKVILKKNGTEVATYTTDDEYNGAFVFPGLEVGEYTVEFEHADYKACDPVAVTVEAAKTSYPTAYLENVAYIPPKNVYVNYPDSLAGKDYALADAYNVKGVAETIDVAEVLAGKTVRRQIVRDNKLYILALDEANEPYIYLGDIKAGTIAELDKAAVTMSDNGRLKISDIALTADHVLVATGLAKNQYSTDQVDAGEVRGAVNVYKWTQNEETGLPETCELWFSSDNSCNMYRCLVGKTITYSGTIEDGILTASGHHATATVEIGVRFAQFAITDGKLASSGYVDCWKAVPNETYFYADVLSSNSDFELMTSPLNKDNFVIDGNRISPFEWTIIDNEGIVAGRNEKIDPKVNGANYFKYNGKTVMTAPAVDADGKITGLVAFDVTNGFDKATEIKVNGAQIEAAEFTCASAHGELALEIDASDRDNPKTIGAEMEFFLVVDGKVYKYTTAGVVQPATANVYAYGLSVTALEEDESFAVLNFNLTGSSTKVDIILTPVAGGEDIVCSLGALEEGENSYRIDKTTLSGDYKWSVSVANKVNNGSDILFSDNTWGASADALFNGGVAIDNDPESANFGNVYVSVDRAGIFAFGPNGEAMNESGYWADHGGALHRGTVSNGKFYVADNSSAKSGIWMFDPANPTVENQVASGNQPCAVSFYGDGADRDMYAVGSYTGASGSQLLKYENIGTADTWTGSPKWVDAADAKMFGSNHFSIITVESGHLISQYREGSSNYAPGFFFINNAGTVYNYATDLAAVLPGCKKSGMALSKDGSLFAIVGMNGQIPVFDVVWNNGIPAFTHKATIQSNEGVIWGLAFDYANNLHCFNEIAGYCVHAVPCDANAVVTPSRMTLNGNASSAIEVIEAESALVEYYNLQGIKVANPEKGIFIKKQGSKATKVVM